MDSTPHPSWITGLLILGVVAALVFRNMRPQKMTVSRFWISPAILVALTATVLWAGEQLTPPPLGLVVLSIGIGVVAGIPLGIARGHHSNVRPGETAGTLYVDPSPVVMAIWLIAFAFKYAVRFLLPAAGPVAAAATDGFMVFAVTSVLVARVVIFRKYETMVKA
ncbi:MAG: hypothetical protein ACLQPV_03515 [Vulcanimicrobiaceae bacterium]